jgi:hypothetical protein
LVRGWKEFLVAYLDVLPAVPLVVGCSILDFKEEKRKFIIVVLLVQLWSWRIVLHKKEHGSVIFLEWSLGFFRAKLGGLEVGKCGLLFGYVGNREK